MDQKELLKIIRQAKQTKATELDLSANELGSLPTEIGQLKNLHSLDLSFNKLSELPAEIGQLKNLQSLNLRNNELSELPAEIRELKNLQSLELYFNELSELPAEIGELKNLQSLSLPSNKLSELPAEIGELKNLQSLSLWENKLGELPAAIGKLENLKQLYLSNNLLKELPLELYHLPKLETIDLAANQLKQISNQILHLKNLRELKLYNELAEMVAGHKNSFETPPPEVINQGLPAIKAYFKNLNKGGKELYEGKLLMLGQGGVGKTCLRQRLIHDTFEEGEVSTEGIDIQHWNIETDKTRNQPMRLNVWDFGGQEIYHATHQFFLTQRSLYILVWDARQEEEYGRIDYWLKTIETFAADSPVIIVMNKADERSKNLNIQDIKERFPQVKLSGKTSSKSGRGIEELREFIKDYAWKMPLMGTFWPNSWLRVRKALEDTQLTLIPYSRYLKVCKKAKINQEEAHTLSCYLHDLGIILHFHQDKLLKQYIIIQPEWGTDAVYKVLDAPSVKKRNGILHESDLPIIWSDRGRYPESRYPIILRLMANFELSFPFGDSGKHIVAELLLPKAVKYDWSTENCLWFEYHYQFLPAGVITRLIVRLHEYVIEQKGKMLCWREGAYLRYENSEALIKINPYTRIATIQIQGSSKRDFLAVIRSHFAAIHRSIKKINYAEKIPCTCQKDCSHRFPYNFLLRCEEKGKETITCEKNIEEVHIKTLLDGFEESRVRQERMQSKYQRGHTEIVFQPNINVATHHTLEVHNSIKIDIQVQVDLPALQNDFAALSQLMADADPNLKEEVQRIEDGLDEVSAEDNKKELKKPMNKMKRFLEKVADENSDYHKAVKGVENGMALARKVTKLYNKFAPWLSLPKVPDVF